MPDTQLLTEDAGAAGAFDVFETYESNVRSYCRDFPILIGRAKGAILYDVDERPYIDFFTGAGALNYGHNPDGLKAALLDYIAADGVSHSLDFYTSAKQAFISAFQRHILLPRRLDYKIQFTGPTGTNAVEAALKLARKVTGRHNVIAFTNAFHGMSLGSLAATASPAKRRGAGQALGGVTFMPYQGYLGPDQDALAYLAAMLADGGGVDAPAAVIVETIQGEGGLRTLDAPWLEGLSALCKAHGALLIVDDIQSGCGRSGQFFSFEMARVEPDIVCLSKSLSGYGLPMSVNLIKPVHDVWGPAEHNGTFRGNNLAFVTARAAIEQFWSTPAFAQALAVKIELLTERLGQLVARIGHQVPAAERRGRGFMQGIYLGDGALAQQVSQLAFELGLIVETCGAQGEVVKLLPALTIDADQLERGLALLETAFERALHPRLAVV